MIEQVYVMQEIAIKDLKAHPKNPRRISPEAKKRLREGMEKHGIVQPIIWNKRTGFVVGGHQRLALIREGKEKEELLQVAVIDVDEAKELELLIFLNNAGSQGHYDEDAMIDILANGLVDRSALGFNDAELDYFNKLMAEAVDRQISAAEKYFEESVELYEQMGAKVEENKEAIEQDKESRKDKWMQITDQRFERPMPASTEKDQAFRDARDNWKGQELIKDSVLKIIFKTPENQRAFLQKIGAPTDSLIIHETELDLSFINTITQK